MKTGTPVCGKNAAYKKETEYDFMKIPHDVHDIKPGKGAKPQKNSLQTICKLSITFEMIKSLVCLGVCAYHL